MGWSTDTGTEEGTGEVPPLEYFNWWQNLVYQWVNYFDGVIGSITSFGTMATQNANAVAITGGTITGTNLNNAIAQTGFVQAFIGSLSQVPAGWMGYVDGTIGSSASSATSRANDDTEALFTQIWEGISQPSANAVCPVSGGLGASAAADWAANKTITLPLAESRVFGVVGSGSGLSTRTFGEIVGEEQHTLTIDEMPPHSHPFNHGNAGPGNAAEGDNAAGNTGVTDVVGGGDAHNNMQPTTFITHIIKL